MRKVKIWCASSVALAMCACNPNWSTPEQNGSEFDATIERFCIDVPPSSVMKVEGALTAWDHALHQWKHVYAIDVHREASAVKSCNHWIRETLVADIPVNEGAIAWTTGTYGDVYLRKGRYEFDPTGIVLHEVGHVFGAQHVAGTLMNTTYWDKGAYTCPDKVTVVQIAGWNRVNPKLLCWCF